MKYYQYIDIPDWKRLQTQLIEYKNKNVFASKQELDENPDKKWVSYTPDILKEDLPDVYSTFKKMGLNIRQMIFFTNTQNDLNIKDPSDIRSVFIHIDAEDSPTMPLKNDYYPTDAINIPLENCEGSTTIFYKKINDDDDVWYTNYCGGQAHTSVEEVDRFELNRPAVIRINIPHAVYNPHYEPRSVATFRFYEDLENFF